MMEVDVRRLENSDVVQLASLANNKKIWDNVRDIMPFPYSEEDASFFIGLTLKENPFQTFGIQFNGELCGVVGLKLLTDVYKGSAELGFWLGEKYWGKGIASQAVELAVSYGFGELKLRRILAGVFDYNAPSMQVLRKNGFREEGISRNAIIKNEKIFDEYLFAKLKEDR